MHGRA